LYFTWAGSKTIIKTLELANRIVEELDEETWYCVFDSIEDTISGLAMEAAARKLDLSPADFPADTTARTLALLRLRIKAKAAATLYTHLLTTYPGYDRRILGAFQEDAIQGLMSSSTEEVDRHLELLARGYSVGVLAPAFAPHLFQRHGPLAEISIVSALRIAEHAGRYPGFLVAAAEARCRDETAKGIRPVAEIAQEERWFDEELAVVGRSKTD
jgi:hypothetical protein